MHLLESYGGLGFYRVNNYTYNREHPERGRDITQARSWNAFWQVQASSKFGRAEFTAAVRLAYSRYPHLRNWHTSEGDEYNYENLGFFTVDPALSQSIVFGRFKMNMQYGLSLLLKEAVATEVRTRYAPSPIITAEEKPITHLMGAVLFRVGLQYNFDLRKRVKEGL